MEDERTNWDRRYRQGSHASSEPDPFLIRAYEEFIAPLFPHGGKALDLAGGVGRHAIWLAERGWQVKLIDISEAGIAKAREKADGLEEKMQFEIADASDFKIDEPYDLVLVFFYLQREIFPLLLKALSPGGLLIYKTYTELQPKFGKGPAHPMHLLRENELLHSFESHLTVLHY